MHSPILLFLLAFFDYDSAGIPPPTNQAAWDDLLWDSKPNTPNYDKLDILITLIEVYEEKKYPIDLPDPIAVIKYKMEELGLKKIDLGKFLGGRSRASEILEKKRKLSLNMIRKLNKELNIPTEILIKDYELKNKNAKVKSAA